MHRSDEQKRQEAKRLVVGLARDIIARRDELMQINATMHGVWQALVAAPTWRIVETGKPKDWVEPEEIWSVTPQVTRR